MTWKDKSVFLYCKLEINIVCQWLVHLEYIDFYFICSHFVFKHGLIPWSFETKEFNILHIMKINCNFQNFLSIKKGHLLKQS